MKYSFMSFSCPQADLQTALEMARKYGYQGFEPRTDSAHAHGIERGMGAERRQQVRSILADSPVKLCCLATSVRLASRSGLPQALHEVRQAIDLCGELQIPAVRIFGGPIDEDDSRAAATERMARILRTLSEEIGKEDITLCMETHDSWTDPVHVAAVMEFCSSPHIAVNWDVMHTRLASGCTEEESAAILGPYIRHVHFHGGSYRPALHFLPVEQSAIDHRAVLRVLHGLQYRGYLSGEWIGWEQPDYLKTEIQTMKKLEEDVVCTA